MAQFSLGRCYADGDGVAQDWAQAATWYRRAAEQGDVEAECYLGKCYANGHGVARDMAQVRHKPLGPASTLTVPSILARPVHPISEHIDPISRYSSTVGATR